MAERRKAGVWVEVGSLENQQRLLDWLESVVTTSGGTLIAVTAPRDGYRTYGALAALLDRFLPIVRAEAPFLLEEYRTDLERLCPEQFGVVASKAAAGSISADAVAYAIVRRISRESAGEASRIDRVARFLLAARAACRSLQGPITIALAGADWCDRPSLRVFYRAQRLGDRTDGLTWQFLFERIPVQPKATGALAAEDLRSRLERVRYLFFARLAEALSVEQVRLGQGDHRAANEPPAGAWAPPVMEIAECLVRHNFERVYTLAAEAMPSARGQDRAEVLRLVALADANLGDYESAQLVLADAGRYATTQPYRAHLHYLAGLLYTKRFYRLDLAEASYRQGLECLDGEPGDDALVRLERSWLINGLSLARTLKAKALPPEQQVAVLDEIVRDEIAAFQLVKGLNGSAAEYLRFNLLSNIAFLLEIEQRYAEAIQFWERAFDRYLQDSSEAGRGFRRVFCYRKGMILQRDGKPEQALAQLREAWSLANEDGDQFLEERIIYGLAYTCLQTGRYGEAVQWFSAGVALARENREDGYVLEHCAGLLHTAAATGDARRFRQTLAEASGEGGAPWQDALRAFDSAPPTGEKLAGFLQTCGLTPPRPSPKLPAYIPSVDLEPGPAADLNRYLVSQGAPPIEVLAGSQNNAAAPNSVGAGGGLS